GRRGGVSGRGGRRRQHGHGAARSAPLGDGARPRGGRKQDAAHARHAGDGPRCRSLQRRQQPRRRGGGGDAVTSVGGSAGSDRLPGAGGGGRIGPARRGPRRGGGRRSASALGRADTDRSGHRGGSCGSRSGGGCGGGRSGTRVGAGGPTGLLWRAIDAVISAQSVRQRAWRQRRLCGQPERG
ncbi:unnamed protein product, partial [Phaeothamnion confervicola]